MKTFLLATMLAAVGTPAIAQNWSHGNSQYRNYGSNYSHSATHANRGDTSHSNRLPGGGYDSGFNHGAGYSRGHSMLDSWGQRSFSPVIRPRHSDDTLHGDFYPRVNNGYGTPLNQPGFNPRHRGHDDYIRY